jgi:hypothetical protein
MSTDAEVVVLALYAEDVMEPLTRDDPNRSWRGRFVPIQSQWGASFRVGWAVEFDRLRSRTGLFAHLESLPWPAQESVQVLMHNQDDDCFGLWMIRDGKLEEVTLPHARRFQHPAPENHEFPPHPGVLRRTDQGLALPEQTPEEDRDERRAW